MCRRFEITYSHPFALTVTLVNYILHSHARLINERARIPLAEIVWRGSQKRYKYQGSYSDYISLSHRMCQKVHIYL